MLASRDTRRGGKSRVAVRHDGSHLRRANGDRRLIFEWRRTVTGVDSYRPGRRKGPPAEHMFVIRLCFAATPYRGG